MIIQKFLLKELQLEDEQYIQPDGLSGHQVSQVGQFIRLFKSVR